MDTTVIIGVVAAAVIVGLWLDYVRPRLNSRPCPRCGHRVPTGDLDCPRCDFDFRGI